MLSKVSTFSQVRGLQPPFDTGRNTGKREHGCVFMHTGMGDMSDEARLRELARVDWVTSGSGGRLHDMRWFDVDADLWGFTNVTFGCGQRPKDGLALIPGFGDRLGASRCVRCCDRAGYPRGVGSPKNDDTCRQILGLTA